MLGLTIFGHSAATTDSRRLIVHYLMTHLAQAWVAPRRVMRRTAGRATVLHASAVTRSHQPQRPRYLACPGGALPRWMRGSAGGYRLIGRRSARTAERVCHHPQFVSVPVASPTQRRSVMGCAGSLIHRLLVIVTHLPSLVLTGESLRPPVSGCSVDRYGVS